MKNRRSYRDVLVESYNDKKSRRPGYSLRAFARDLSMTPSHLNDVLYARRGLSLVSASRIAEVLQLSENEKVFFIDLVELEHGRSESVRNLASLRVEKRKRAASRQIEDSDVEFLKNWITPVILELVTTRRGDVEAQFVSNLLGVSKSAVNESLKALQRLGLVAMLEDKLIRVSDYVLVSSKRANLALRAFHRQILKIADQRFDQVPVERRENLSSVMSFDQSRISEAKDWLADMHDEFITKFGGSQNADSVFVLTQHLFQADIGSVPGEK